MRNYEKTIPFCYNSIVSPSHVSTIIILFLFLFQKLLRQNRYQLMQWYLFHHGQLYCEYFFVFNAMQMNAFFILQLYSIVISAAHNRFYNWYLYMRYV
jgi:hypothetical protein